jgi:hypothetical protein
LIAFGQASASIQIFISQVFTVYFYRHSIRMIG